MQSRSSICRAWGIVVAIAWATSSLTTQPAQAEQPVVHRVLAQDNGRVAIIGKDGQVEWEVECRHGSHDIHLLPSGNFLLHTGPTTIVEMTPQKEVVWKYVSQKTPENKGGLEVHAFQRLANGNTMIAESGNRRIIEVNAKGEIVHQIPLVCDRPNAHRDTRMARQLPSGNYLVCHEMDGVVREYDRTGKVVWSYALDLGGRPAAPGHGPEGHGKEVFGAIRVPTGNTVIATGNGNRVIEVNPAGEIVWKIEQNELPGIQLAWVTTLQYLPNGNLVIGNCHAGKDNPQLIEVTRDKKVVWTFKDFKHFGNGLAVSQVLDIEGEVIR